MKNKFSFIFVAALLLLLTACANVKTPQDQASTSIPQPGGAEILADPVPESMVSSNHAVIALLDQARQDTGARQHGAAGASLERALRIEPRNAWLWHELAQLRQEQGQYTQAISLAHKSISFAGRERRLQALNWRLIANARVAQGDASGADQAYKLATELDQPEVPKN